MQVKLHFMEDFREPILDGPLFLTLRSQAIAAPGDFFYAFGQRCRVVAVFNIIARHVAESMWWIEGATSLEDYKATWEHLHPSRPLDSYMVAHMFVRE